MEPPDIGPAAIDATAAAGSSFADRASPFVPGAS
jgi:hypothetical protein